MRKLQMPIRTARLDLREFVRGDLDGIHAYSSDPRVTRFLFFGPRTLDSTAEYLDGLLDSQLERPRTRFELAVVEQESGALIGACDLSLVETNVMDLGYMLGSAWWGRGYATELAVALGSAWWGRGYATELAVALAGRAFDELRAERVISTVDVNNKASIRVLEKVGMRWEAVYRRHRRAKNRWWDCHLYTLPREVWDAAPPAREFAR